MMAATDASSHSSSSSVFSLSCFCVCSMSSFRILLGFPTLESFRFSWSLPRFVVQGSTVPAQDFQDVFFL
eukprot:6009983-Amphidinium_carterae.1